MAQRGDDATALRYRFDDVVIESHGRRIFVGARERAASRRAFDLLLTLCEMPGRVLTRDELSERLWPGGQIVSDEALTQAIFRARAVLGAHGERIVTVRGIGIRFDALVTCEAVTAPAPAVAVTFNDVAVAIAQDVASATPPAALVDTYPPASAGHDDTAGTVDNTSARYTRRASDRAPAPAPRRGLWRLAGGLAALLLLVALAWWYAMPRAATSVDTGYGISASDVHAAHPDTARLLGEAIRHDNSGDRPRGRAVLETLTDSDPRTPWPVLILALWSIGAGDTEVADAWLARARTRAAVLQDPYVNAMLRYVEAERSGSAQDVIRYAGAVLDLRPQAWRMHLARAHLKYYQGLREAALAEIRQIEIHEWGNRKLEGALADRASFGDVAGAQAVLDAMPRGGDEAAHAYLSGRIAWSRGDKTAARQAWERAAEQAQRNGRSDIGNRALANAGFAAMLAGEHAAAISHFERARVGMVESRWVTDDIDLSLLLAQLQALAGNSAAARAEFLRAVAASGRTGTSSVTNQVVLMGARLFPDVDTQAIALETTPAAQALLAARRAYARSDRVTAQHELVLAQQRGVLELSYADEARLLAAELGLSVAPERVLDPPYPPLAAAAARLVLASRGTAVAPSSP